MSAAGANIGLVAAGPLTVPTAAFAEDVPTQAPMLTEVEVSEYAAQLAVTYDEVGEELSLEDAEFVRTYLMDEGEASQEAPKLSGVETDSASETSHDAESLMQAVASGTDVNKIRKRRGRKGHSRGT